jgi:bifunctional non-homologous end joining protein LigD
MTPHFVIHEHHATHLHYDFRLELDGVLKSWVVPKGPSMNPSEKRLALLVQDHPLEYIDFEGIIPKEHYGAGAVVIWDKGSYELIELQKETITFFLRGRKLNGIFTLLLLKGRRKGDEWLLIKKKDEYASINWKLEKSLSPEKKSQLQEQMPPCKTA